MPIVKQTESNFKPMPAGTHLARCYGMVSLGTQLPNSPQFNPSFKILLMFETPNELAENGKPLTCFQEFSASLSEKSKLRPALESWRGRPFTKEELDGFDVANVVGAPCMISIIHKQSAKGSTYAVIAGIAALPKGMTCPPQVHPKIIWEIEHGRNAVYQSLPEFIQKKISACVEWSNPAPSEPEYDGGSDVPPEEDVPF